MKNGGEKNQNTSSKDLSFLSFNVSLKICILWVYSYKGYLLSIYYMLDITAHMARN